MKQPTLFISHGSPMIMIEPSQSRAAIIALADKLEKPDAIVIASAHFETEKVEVVSDPSPKMMYDFGRFDDRLFEMNYPANGSPRLAGEVFDLLTNAGIGAKPNPKRSFDHGVWTPLMLAFPQADIPIVQLSVQPNRDADHHYRVGKALSSLRDQNVLVIGSGHITHNLKAVFNIMQGGEIDPQNLKKIQAFVKWIEIALMKNDTLALCNWQENAPFASFNHPTPEHLMPLFFAAGAGSSERAIGVEQSATLLHRSTQYEYLISDIWRFD